MTLRPESSKSKTTRRAKPKRISAYDEANKQADTRFAEFGIATLNENEMAEIIHLKKADKIAEDLYGEFGFATLKESEMKQLLNENPQLLKSQRRKKSATVKKSKILKTHKSDKYKSETVLSQIANSDKPYKVTYSTPGQKTWSKRYKNKADANDDFLMVRDP